MYNRIDIEHPFSELVLYMKMNQFYMHNFYIHSTESDICLQDRREIQVLENTTD